MNLGEKIVAMFNDMPISETERELFVNREIELTKLTNVGRFMQKSMYGLAGETGCGKTTLFNMLKFPDEIEKLIITISEKESKEAIIADILYKLCKLILNSKRFKSVHKKANTILQFIREEETKSAEKGIKIGKFIEGESRWATISKERYSISAIKERLYEAITSITEVTKVVICIDEIDKERKEDALVILDSIKDILKIENVSSLIALPPIMYQQYLEDRDSLFSKANLENILKDILPIDKMSDDDIEDILDRRTKLFPEVLPVEVKDVVIKFADGNPREALLLCQNAILSKKFQEGYQKEDFILTLDEIKNEMEKFLKFRIAALKLTPRENEFLRCVRDKAPFSRKEILNSTRLRMSKPTRHKIIERLLTKRALQEPEPSVYRIDKRVMLYYTLFETEEI